MLHNICLSMYLLHNYLNEINFIMKTNFIFCCIYDCPVFLGLLINIDQRVTIINELLKSNECYGKKSAFLILWHINKRYIKCGVSKHASGGTSLFE